MPELNSQRTQDFSCTIERVDRAVVSWFDKTVDARVTMPDKSLRKVPCVFTQGERWIVGRSKQSVRDENGVLILPVFSVRRTGFDNDASMSALGVQTPRLTYAKLVDPKTERLRNLEGKKVNGLTDPVVYDVYSVPFPTRLVVNYQIVLQTQFIEHMNLILEKIWRSVDVQRQFVAPLDNPGRHGALVQDDFTAGPAQSQPYVVGFFQSSATDSGNMQDFTEEQRIIQYMLEVKVPAALVPQPEGEPAVSAVRRTAYKLVIPDENVTFVDDPADLDAIFGK